MIVLDTHVWVCWIDGSTRLSGAAREAIEAAMKQGSVHISSMNAWEVAMLVRRKRLELTMDVSDWIRKCESIPFLNFVPVDNDIALRSVLLPTTVLKDPADRIIVATAIELGTSLVTKDHHIQAFDGVRTIW